jgi:hypothetical protein
MPKLQRRKPPKRARPKTTPPPKIDADLAELALALDESKHTTATHWQQVPWRKGCYAVSLALTAAGRLNEKLRADEDTRLIALADLVGRPPYLPGSYESGEMILEMLTEHPAPPVINIAMRATVRCWQLLVSHSDSGGHGYNAVLTRLAEHLLPSEVLYWRCRDAIGVFPALLNNADDKLRRAFTIAWGRGLYRAAYSLPLAQHRIS